MASQVLIKKRDREKTIKKLLEAGVAVFSTYGYDAATTKLIAKYADINESLISRYFDGKSGLLVEIMRSFMEKEKVQGSLGASYPKGSTVEEEISNYFQYKFQHYLKTKRFLKVIFSRAIIDPKVAREMQKKTHRGIAPLLLARLTSLQEQGHIRADIDIERTCFTICHTCFSMGFVGHTVLGLKKEYILGALGDYAKNFSLGISEKSLG